MNFKVKDEDKALLIEMFKHKDAKRNKFLFECYSSIITSKHITLRLIAKFISEHLGIEILEADIKYCRHHFKDKRPIKNIVTEVKNTLPNQQMSMNELSWSDEDDILKTTSSLTSKFSKK